MKRTCRVTAIFSICIFLATFATSEAIGRSKKKTDTLTLIPFGGNAWRTDKDTTGGNISNEGIINWSSAKATFTSYVRFGQMGKLNVYLHLSVPKGRSSITVTALGISKTITTSGSGFRDVYVGDWMIRDTGYIAFQLKGVSKTGDVFADITGIALSGDPVKSKMSFVKDNEGQFFYWGRRGPSVHLGYTVPDGVNAEWFYNEVTVPKGNDVLGSYFMACGFAEGYFGMQVNSPTERHILFSVWSPFNTDDPKSIPEDQKIIMLKKGDNVHTGEFGNEGSGGQSYMNFMWKAGTTYKFLVHAKPDGKGRTEYTAYFFAPEAGKWQLIAGFSRPKTDTYLEHLHSFLENFEPEQGTKTREVHFNNGWICDSNGKWMELTKARFTADNTGAKGYRMDYAGGVKGQSFFLKNCGFFNNYTPRNIFFEWPRSGKKLNIDLSKLP
ncbi:DUF3472 domain-containing protein [Mucilaginibacter ginsenosidivorans]|nr:DUF3472 domain-containing protein [Mucilaginibacter ginsenosidivorans]